MTAIPGCHRVLFTSVPKRFDADLVMQKLCKLGCFIAPNEDLMLFN